MKLIQWIESKLTSTRERLLLMAGASFVSFFSVFLFWNEINEQDWNLANGYGLLNRSSILNYGVFPVHDPWVCGGLNVVANPLNHIFSPKILVDLMLPPYWANVFMLVLFGFFGIWGMFSLLRSLKISPLVSFIVGMAFINTTWFGLHYSAGHTTFASTQLIPWVALSVLRISEWRHQVILCFLSALFLLEGNIHAAVFSIELIVTLLIFGLIPKAQILGMLKKPWFFLLCMVAMMLFCMPKLYPNLVEFADRTPVLDHTFIPLHYLAFILFSPIQVLLWSFDAIQWKEGGTHYEFHEFGCYVGILAAILIIRFLWKPENRQGNWKWILFSMFWLWCGAGWVFIINPWNTFVQTVPIINNVHLQARVLILMWIGLCVLLAKALQSGIDRNRIRYLKILLFLLIEFVIVKNIPFAVYAESKLEPVGYNLVESESWGGTQIGARKPYHYYLGKGSKTCYEPSAPASSTKHELQVGYRGEIYFSKGDGTGSIDSFTPARLSLSFDDAKAGDELEINTNSLEHWRVVSGPATVVRNPDDGTLNLRLKVEGSEGKVKLEFWPSYLTTLLYSYFAGISLFLLLVFCVIRRKRLLP